MLKARELPPEEWGRLVDTPLGEFARFLIPGETSVVVVEDDGPTIVATWALVKLWHVEGVWIAPQRRRRAGIARRLLDAMKTIMAHRGARAVMTGAESAEVRHLIQEHLGAVRMPDQFMWAPDLRTRDDAHISPHRDVDRHGGQCGRPDGEHDPRQPPTVPRVPE